LQRRGTYVLAELLHFVVLGLDLLEDGLCEQMLHGRVAGGGVFIESRLSLLYSTGSEWLFHFIVHSYAGVIVVLAAEQCVKGLGHWGVAGWAWLQVCSGEGWQDR